MMKNEISAKGIIALMVGHCAGMVDLVALPIWVATLMRFFHLDPQQAGSVVTLFLIGSVMSSTFVAPRILKVNRRHIAILGFVLAAVFISGAVFWTDFNFLLLWHLLAGLSVGAALSMTHGTIALSHNPHRLFAIVSSCLGVFSVIFLAVTPQIIEVTSGETLFIIFSGIMALAAVTCLFFFPKKMNDAGTTGSALNQSAYTRLSTSVWLGMAGICLMALSQSMTFSFLERIGDFRGFSFAAISGVLIAVGVVNLLPAPLAGLLERRLSIRVVLLLGPILQALISFTITHTSYFPLYAATASVFAGVMIFTHTFAFGFLSRLDKTGRAMAATPAILMVGSAVGPILGGTLAKLFSYESVGVISLIVGAGAFLCFSRVTAVKPDAVLIPGGRDAKAKNTEKNGVL